MRQQAANQETIVAEATPQGFGGISVVRVSGPLVPSIMLALFSRSLSPRQADYLPFYDDAGVVIDMGVAIYFKAPHSFTGEEVLELQGHGGPMVVQLLLSRLLALGARLANPGEFSERAFLNNKIDLTQAEAILDLIHASSHEAARLAVRSLQGEFAAVIQAMAERLLSLRTYIEAAIDFSDEEIDFLGLSSILESLTAFSQEIESLLSNAKQGQLLREGIKLVIVGKPNAGKSSLLNCLCAKDVAIVTPIPGTTRDVIRDYILMDGIPLQLVDTAGFRESNDLIEQEGIKRAQNEIQQADVILHVIDASVSLQQDDISYLPQDIPIISVFNKIDLLAVHPVLPDRNDTSIFVSVKTGDGVPALKALLKKSMGFKASTEGIFLARLRHIEALQKVKVHLDEAKRLLQLQESFELIAEELRLAHLALCEITGIVTNDDLLGNIFKTFCIGK